MNCPKCGGKTIVINSRPKGPTLTRRTRICESCAKKFDTYEEPAELSSNRHETPAKS